MSVTPPCRARLQIFGDYIIDDSPHKENISNFRVKLLDWGTLKTYKYWNYIQNKKAH